MKVCIKLNEFACRECWMTLQEVFDCENNVVALFCPTCKDRVDLKDMGE